MNCPRDGFPMVLDTVTARACVDAGWDPVELWTCANGHSHRVWPDPPAPRVSRKAPPCRVCGRPVRQPNGGKRKDHPGACHAFVQRQRMLWSYRHTEALVIERQPWYRGPRTFLSPPAPPPLEPLDPLQGGWRLSRPFYAE